MIVWRHACVLYMMIMVPSAEDLLSGEAEVVEIGEVGAMVGAEIGEVGAMVGAEIVA